MARLAILLAGAVLALAGCGTDREPTAARTATPTPVATAGRTQPVIAEPPAGATITADTQEDDRYRVAVDVRGVAEPDERVVVSTGCQDEGCRKAVFAAGDGAFAATVDLTVDAEQPRGTIIVGYEDSGASVATDRVIVTVGTPGVADPPKETQSPEPSATPGARNVVVIGDSLAVGMQPYLAEFLAGWAIDVDARAGRTLEEGMRVFGAEARPQARHGLRLQPVHQRRPGQRHRARERGQAQLVEGLRGLGHDRRRQALHGGQRAAERARRRVTRPAAGRPVGGSRGPQPRLADRRRARHGDRLPQPRRALRRRDQELHARGVTTFGSGIGSGRPATLQNAKRPLWKSTAARYG